jgi:hypothetical protein
MYNNNFYSFSGRLPKSAVYLDSDLLDWDIACELIFGDYSHIPNPLLVKQKSGKVWFDILCPSIGLYFVSDRFIKILIDNKITGWKTFPLLVTNKQGTIIEGYSGFSITGRAGKIDYSKSEIIEKRAVPNGPLTKYYKGDYFEEDKGIIPISSF